MEKSWLLVVPIPALFALGIAAFFIFFPKELITLSNLVSYMSSLSTTIMVLVYVLTTSRQLDTMGRQLREMQYSRDVQVQPLPYLENPKAYLGLPRYYAGPEENFKKMKLSCDINFSFSVSNIGNGPAISIDFIPFVAKISLAGEPTVLLMETITSRIDCISLREGHSQEREFHFTDEEYKVPEALLAEGRIALHCTMVYKNTLGMSFKENIAFWAEVPSRGDLETIRSCLKVVKTAEIDFAEQVKEFERLMDFGREEEAYEILEKVNAELKKTFAGKEKLDLSMTTGLGLFELRPISQSEYEEVLSKKREQEKKLVEDIRRCWRTRGRGPDKAE